MKTVGLIGTGGMGNVHTNHYGRIPDVQVIAWDSDPGRLKAFCEKHGVNAAWSEADLMAQADVVDICLPTDLHLSVALRAVAAGKHVFVEKPMCSTYAQCQELIGAAQAAGVQVIPGHVVRFFPEFRTAHNLVASGKVGKPAAARLRRGGKTPMGSEGWFRDHGRSGGVLLDLAVHDFDWLSWTLGPVTSVFSRSVGVPGTSSVPGDYALTTLKFANGAVAHVESTWMDPSGFRTTLEVSGNEGMIEFDLRQNQAVRTTTEESTVFDNGISGSDDPYFAQITTMLAVLFEGAEPVVTAEEGARAVAIAEAALASCKSGEWIDV